MFVFLFCYVVVLGFVSDIHGMCFKISCYFVSDFDVYLFISLILLRYRQVEMNFLLLSDWLKNHCRTLIIFSFVSDFYIICD